MSELTGVRELLRLILRLDRVRLSVWVAGLGLLPAFVGATFAALYDTEAARAELAATVTSAPAMQAVLGPVNGTSVGSLVAWRVGTVGVIFVAFMAAFTVIRHTRQNEETGRAELVGATVVGRNAPLTAAVGVAVGAAAVIAVLLAGGLVALGEELAGAAAMGLGWLGAATVFAGVGAVAAQVPESARAARVLAAQFIGLVYALRAVADAATGYGWLGWVSPIGWVTRLEAFGEERWWVLLLFVGAAALAWTAAGALRHRRDVGAGLLVTRTGPPVAAAGLSSASGLARRLQLRSLAGWVVGLVGFGTMWGLLADSMNQLLAENEQLAAILELMGGTELVTEAFFSTAFSLTGLLVAAFTIGTVLTLHTEESEGRAEPVLATPTTRVSWAGGHLVFAFVGPVLLLTLAGVTAGLTYGASSGDVGGVLGDALQRSVLVVPAVWVFGGLTVALYGWLPRRAGLAWGLLAVEVLIGLLGEALQLPQWVLDLSPFGHVPTPPDAITPTPLLVLSGLAAALVAAGLAGLRRRDVG